MFDIACLPCGIPGNSVILPAEYVGRLIFLCISFLFTLHWHRFRTLIFFPHLINPLQKWSLPCVRDNSYGCVYTRGLVTQTESQHNTFDSEKNSFCAPDGIQTQVMECESDALPIEPPATHNYILTPAQCLRMSFLCDLRMSSCPTLMESVLIPSSDSWTKRISSIKLSSRSFSTVSGSRPRV